MEEMKKKSIVKLFDLWQDWKFSETYGCKEDRNKLLHDYCIACELLLEIGLFTEDEIEQMEDGWRNKK